MSSPSHQVPTRAARQDPDAPLRVDLRIPFAACAVEGFLLLGLYTLLTYLKLPRLTLLGLVFLGVYALSVGVTFTAFAWRLSRSRRNIRTAELLTADIYRMFRSVMDIPYAVINGDNRVRVINAAMQSILGARSPVCDLPLSEICPAVTREQLLAALRNPGDGRICTASRSRRVRRTAPARSRSRWRTAAATAWSRTCSASRRTPTTSCSSAMSTIT